MNAKASLLLIYTGGTIGMKKDPTEQTLKPFDFNQIMEEVPELKKFALKIDSYTFTPLIDSSDVEPALWQDLARLIESRYNDYDGFVVLHGTDTMAYSASMLSFMLHNLRKPVVFTGSQLPIGEPRTDGKENLVSSVEIAAAKDRNGNAMVPEVCICFHSLLLRGNRCIKTDATGFEAFASPNYPPLATAGIDIVYNSPYIRRPECDKPFEIHTKLDTRVAILRVHPGITEQVVKDTLLGDGSRAVIIESYGSGNAISKAWFTDIVAQADRRGKILVNVTQCNKGVVNMNLYATGMALKKVGVVSGKDITVESALSKLFHLMGESPNDAWVKARFEQDLMGEISE